jgi:hypothetical protein
VGAAICACDDEQRDQRQTESGAFDLRACECTNVYGSRVCARQALSSQASVDDFMSREMSMASFSPPLSTGSSAGVLRPRDSRVVHTCVCRRVAALQSPQRATHDEHVGRD